MLDIDIIAVGSLKIDYFNKACAEYLKRLSPYAKIKVIEVKSSNLAGINKEKSKRDEGERLNNVLIKYFNATIFLLEEKGGAIDSLQFSEQLNSISGKIVFVIGGTAGIDQGIINPKYKKLSLSAMTFNHEMARVMLVEQLYRATTIISGKSYHY